MRLDHMIVWSKTPAERSSEDNSLQSIRVDNSKAQFEAHSVDIIVRANSPEFQLIGAKRIKTSPSQFLGARIWQLEHASQSSVPSEALKAATSAFQRLATMRVAAISV